MAKHEGDFFWGVLFGAIAAAIAGCLVLSRSCKTFPTGPGPAKDSAKPTPKRKAVTVRRAAAKRK
ncbi:MAG: hypothetical protein MUC72_10155 [Acidobacteria bacterium]|jgi:hypothetical protein|nr:hypothetical protein [Acidobacteriota bacterium]